MRLRSGCGLKMYAFGQMRELRRVVAYCLTSKIFSRISYADRMRAEREGKEETTERGWLQKDSPRTGAAGGAGGGVRLSGDGGHHWHSKGGGESECGAETERTLGDSHSTAPPLLTRQEAQPSVEMGEKRETFHHC